ncbi:FAD/NAD(P)-binding protein [Streptomyces atriruber]|uniref:FAD/NAD(P)-binding protein n=1 Tax=Streptomyces atriruber TaxID=545121 RepID=A0ABV3BTS9_9ACTN
MNRDPEPEPEIEPELDLDLAVVGGGAAAVALLDALATGTTGTTGATGSTAPVAPGTIRVFEPSPHLWRGRPYGPDLDAVRVNVPPGISSIRHGDTGHYTDWLGERAADHIDRLLGLPVVPRALYGEYLTHTAEKAVAALAEQGRRVEVVPARVTGVTRHGSRLVLRTADNRAYAATQVALCVGTGSPPDPYGLAGTPGHIADPYPLASTLDQVPAESDVAVIGSGLTAVDVVVALAARGHRGRITLLSRTGVLPYVWQRPVDRRPRHLTAERVTELHAARGTVTLDALVDLLRAELTDAEGDFEALAAELRATTTTDPARRLRQQLDAVDDPRIGRRMLQSAAHAVGPYAWRLLTEADRARLRRHLRTANAVASPMVPVNASVLMRLLDSGQLTVTRGDVRGGLRGGLRQRVSAGPGRVINAVNPPPQSIPAAARHLVASLVDTGLGALHPAGGLVPADPRVHVVGDLAGGGSFIASSIPGIAAQASRTAQALRTPLS